MSEEWFYAQNGKEFGPYGSAQLKRLGASGQIQPTDLVWKAGMSKRVPARSVKGLCPGSAPAKEMQTAAARTAATAAEEPVELTAVEPAAHPTQAVVSTAASTQVEDTVELTAIEAATAPAAPVVPSPPPFIQPAAPAFPTPPTAPPAPQVPVSSRVRQPEPRPAFVTDDDAAPRGRRRPRKYSGGSRLWVWLLLAGFAVLILGGVVTVLIVALNQSKVTPENWARVQPGMSEAEVVRILGEPDLHFGLGSTKMMSWRNGSNVYQVTLRNGQVAAKNSGQFDGDLRNFGGPTPGGINFPGP
jgi:hypothetical protein